MHCSVQLPVLQWGPTKNTRKRFHLSTLHSTDKYSMRRIIPAILEANMVIYLAFSLTLGTEQSVRERDRLVST